MGIGGVGLWEGWIKFKLRPVDSTFSESDSIFHFLKPFLPVVLLFWTDRAS